MNKSKLEMVAITAWALSLAITVLAGTAYLVSLFPIAGFFLAAVLIVSFGVSEAVLRELSKDDDYD